MANDMNNINSNSLMGGILSSSRSNTRSSKGGITSGLLPSLSNNPSSYASNNINTENSGISSLGSNEVLGSKFNRQEYAETFGQGFSDMNNSMSGMSQNISNAITTQTKELMSGFSNVVNAITESNKNMQQFLQTLFQDRYEGVNRFSNIEDKLTQYQRALDRGVTGVVIEKVTSLFSEIMKPVTLNEVKNTFTKYVFESFDSIASFFGVSTKQTLPDGDKIVPFTLEISRAIKYSYETLTEIEKNTHQTFKLFKTFSSGIFKYIETTSNDQTIRLEDVTKTEIYRDKVIVNLEKANTSLLDITNHIVNIGAGLALRSEKDDEMYLQRMNRDIHELRINLNHHKGSPDEQEIKDRLSMMEKQKTRFFGEDKGKNKERNSLFKSIKDSFITKEDTKKLIATKDISESANKYKREYKKEDTIRQSIQLKNTSSIEELTKAIKNNIIAINNLESTQKELSEDLGDKSKTSLFNVFSDMFNILKDPLSLTKLLSRGLLFAAKWGALYRAADWVVGLGRKGIESVSNFGLGTTSDGTQRTVGTLTSTAWNGLKTFVDPLITGIRDIFKDFIGEETFNRISMILATTKNFVGNLWTGMFGPEGERAEARKKLFEPIKEGFEWVTKTLILPALYKGFSLYMGTKTLLHPGSLFGNIGVAYRGIRHPNWKQDDWERYSAARDEKKFVKQLTRGAILRRGMGTEEGVQEYLTNGRGRQLLEARFGGDQRQIDAFTNRLLDQKDYDFGGKFKTGWRGGLNRVASGVGGVFSTGFRWIGNIFKVIPVLGQVIALVNTLSWVGQGLKKVWDWFKQEGGQEGDYNGFKGFVRSAVGNFFSTAGDAVTGFIKNGGLKTIWAGISGAVSGIKDFIIKSWSDLWDNMGSVADLAWEGIKSVGIGFWKFLQWSISKSPLGKLFGVTNPYDDEYDKSTRTKRDDIDEDLGVRKGSWRDWAYKKLHNSSESIRDTVKTYGKWGLATAGAVKGGTVGGVHGAVAGGIGGFALGTFGGDAISNALDYVNENWVKSNKVSTNPWNLKSKDENFVGFLASPLGQALLSKNDISYTDFKKASEENILWLTAAKNAANAQNSADMYKSYKYGLWMNQEMVKDEKIVNQVINSLKTRLKREEQSIGSGITIGSGIMREFKIDDKVTPTQTGAIKLIYDNMIDKVAKELSKGKKKPLVNDTTSNDVTSDNNDTNTQEDLSKGVASLGQLSQWIQNGTAKKWLNEQFTSLGDQIKGAWNFLKNQDYKKMFGDAMATFGGISGSIMSSIFGEDVAMNWLNEAYKYADKNGQTTAKRFFAGARSSLVGNVKDIAGLASKLNTSVEAILEQLKKDRAESGLTGNTPSSNMTKFNGPPNGNVSAGITNHTAMPSSKDGPDTRAVYGRHILPGLANPVYTSRYGMRNIQGKGEKLHAGIDLAGAGIEGTAVYPAWKGEVYEHGDSGNTGYGKYVVLKHKMSDGKTFYTRYAHLNEIGKAIFNGKGTVVYPYNPNTNTGTVVGLAGKTGGSTGAHLHFGVGSTATTRDLDPVTILDKYKGENSYIFDSFNPETTDLTKNIGIALDKGEGGFKLGANTTTDYVYGLQFDKMKNYVKNSSRYGMRDEFKSALENAVNSQDPKKALTELVKNSNGSYNTAYKDDFKKLATQVMIKDFGKFGKFNLEELTFPSSYFLMDQNYHRPEGVKYTILHASGKADLKQGFEDLKSMSKSDPYGTGELILKGRYQYWDEDYPKTKAGQKVIKDHPSWIEGFKNRMIHIAAPLGYKETSRGNYEYILGAYKKATQDGPATMDPAITSSDRSQSYDVSKLSNTNLADKYSSNDFMSGKMLSQFKDVDQKAYKNIAIRLEKGEFTKEKVEKLLSKEKLELSDLKQLEKFDKIIEALYGISSGIKDDYQKTQVLSELKELHDRSKTIIIQSGGKSSDWPKKRTGRGASLAAKR